MKSSMILFLLFFQLFCFGCANTSKQVDTNDEEDMPYLINLEDCLKETAPVRLSDIADNIQYIELKSPDSLPIGVITNINISDEFIFISFKGACYQFDKNGNYIRPIGKRGQGPGEYTAVRGGVINENEKTVSLVSDLRIFTYSFDGDFLKHDEIGSYSDVLYKDSLIYASNIPGGTEKYLMTVLNLNLDTIGGIPNYNIFDTKGGSMMITRPFRQPFYEYEDAVYFKGYQENDTIWRINGLNHTVHAIIDMGKYKRPLYKNWEELYSLLGEHSKERGDYYLVNTVVEDDRFIYLSVEPYYNPEMGSPFVLFDKSQNRGIAAETEWGSDGITDDLLGGPAFWPKIITEDCYYSVTDAYQFVEEAQSLTDPSSQFKKFTKGINEESNPIITIVKKKNTK